MQMETIIETLRTIRGKLTDPKEADIISNAIQLLNELSTLADSCRVYEQDAAFIKQETMEGVEA